MAFERVEVVVPAGRNGMPASVRLTVSVRKGGSVRTACWVALSRDFTVEAKIAGNEKFDLLLGSGQDKGLMRLARNPKGALAAMPMGKGGVRFNCGFIERFGTEPEPKQFCAAKVIDRDTIEITLPDWAIE